MPSCEFEVPWHVNVGQVRRMLDHVRPHWQYSHPWYGRGPTRPARLDAVIEDRIRTLASTDELPPGEVHLIISEADGVREHDRQERAPSLDGRKIQMLFVKTLTGKTITLFVTDQSTLADVKAAIQDKEGIPADIQRLAGGPFCLKDMSHKLCDLKIESNATLYVLKDLRGC